ncbi:HK97 family phage prohead protease [Paracoccus nototheniae]|uniref:HK97 family phage prohead protease n=1 Tax=Paracoccus nototheniae TaxID=2489002 RepID=A0ABW4DY86_9RHOB|nr:HK97 family phage prohead protease [Paracoccus nototheniae]
MTQKPEAEKRSTIVKVERRASEDGKVTVAGYAAVFGEVTSIAGYFDEVIARGAFTTTLASSDVLAYFDHDRGRILGRTASGTLRLAEDEKGLSVEIDLPDTSDGRDVRTLIERGDIRGMSFGFRVTKEEWDETGAVPKRTILAVELREVSIVSEPAYDGTSIAMRSLEEARKERRAHNFTAAERRVSARRAAAEARFRGIV